MGSLIDDIKNYWNRQPCNIRYSSSEIGTIKWSYEVSQRKYFVGSHVLQFADFPKWKNKKVLEIGCGIGSDTLEFHGNGAKIDAVELSYESLKIADQRMLVRFPSTRWGNVNFYLANAEEWLPNDKYDLIWSFGVLHHTPNPEKVLKLAHDRLKDDGELRIMLYAKWSIKHLVREQPEAQAGCPLAKVYSAKEAEMMLNRNGFKVKNIRKTHIFPWKISDYYKYKYTKRWAYRWMPDRLFRWLESKFGWHLLIVAEKS